jgi:homoserine kinase type II
MAVKTLFSTEDFEQILSNYDLGKFKDSSPFKTGAVQTNILLETSKGKAVFRYYENRTENHARFEMTVLEYLTGYDCPCPAPIKNKQGEYIGSYHSKSFALLEFLEGEHSNSEDNGKQIAEVLGKLHALTTGYKPDYAEARDTYNPTSCLKSATANIQKIASTFEAEARLTWLKDELAKLQFPETLPKGVCHCDTHPSNFLYEDDKLVAVLDFDDASYVYLFYDIANMLFFWAWPDKGELNFEKTKELLSTYEQHRKLTEIEKQYFYDVLQMVNFMGIGWFIDNDDIYYNSRRKTEFLNTMGRKTFYNRVFQFGRE